VAAAGRGEGFAFSRKSFGVGQRWGRRKGAKIEERRMEGGAGGRWSASARHTFVGHPSARAQSAPPKL
jgi:hypothetical protein